MSKTRTEDVTHIKLKKKGVLETEVYKPPEVSQLEESAEPVEDISGWLLEMINEYNITLGSQYDRIVELEEGNEIKEIMLEELSRRRREDLKELGDRYNEEVIRNGILDRKLRLYESRDIELHSTKDRITDQLNGVHESKLRSSRKLKSDGEKREIAVRELASRYL